MFYAEIEWTFERIARCEAQIWRIALQSLNSGNDVVFDLGLQKITDRERIKEHCEKVGLEYVFYCLVADKGVRQKRVMERNKGVGATFEFPVSEAMFEITDGMFEPPTELELTYINYVDTAETVAAGLV